MKILLVDDDPAVLESLTITLEESGHKVTGARDGVDAIRLGGTAHYDLMITDLIMPGKEGIETIAHFKKHYSDTKIIAISGGARTSPSTYLRMAKALGAEETLAKPFSAFELLSSIERVQ